MDTLSVLSTIALVNIMGWLSPGPNMFAVMSASLNQGRRHGVLTGFGISLASFIWAVLAVLGVTALFELFPDVVLAFRLLGAGYLLWLGIKSFRSAARMDNTQIPLNSSNSSGLQAFRTGFLICATNPKAALFFGSILTAFVPANASTELLVEILIVCVAFGVSGHTITATVFSTEFITRKFIAMRRQITQTFGAIFTLLGLGVAYDALRRL
ncbi:LysE family translocator [Kiloniella antarctica]|uniref:LysE family translocator n=1 Tax=Kiloniella antarctica TaxID=1550907 RepID=A0ABW5BIC9_9PROT